MSRLAQAEAEARHPLRFAAGGRDEKSWAKRFVYRYENGDKTLTTVQIHFAYMALELPIPTGGQP
jgi:hypothetical protein